MSPEELQQYYVNEKPPFSTFKGPEKVGDSLFNILNPQVVPTETVYADALLRWGEEGKSPRERYMDSVDNADQKMKPKVALGMGRLGYFGDLYGKRFQSPLTARMAYDLNISQRLTRYLQLNFNVMFGQLGANENKDMRHENFQAEIRAGGLNLLYDFGNWIPDKYTVRPFISFGVAGFEFLSKTDLKDKNGNTYYYWSDGSIKDKAEGSPDAQFAKDIQRDYTYETDVRERNADGFGKYREAAIAFPVGAGFVMKVTDRVDIKMNFQMFFTTTDYIDGVSNKSIGNRVGNKQKDNFSYTSFAVQYDLIAKPRQKAKLEKDTMNNAFWLAFDAGDSDKDGVTDFKDECHGTEAGVKVKDNGCPPDDDNDGVPNYRDDELSTQAGVAVNEKGVGLTDDYWKSWYTQYANDSIGENVQEEYVGNVFDLNKKDLKIGNDKRDLYTVELARYQGSIPSEEMALLLSIGDIKSQILDDGTTVVYTAGEYRKLKNAVKRRDEFRNEGKKDAAVSRIKGKNIERLSEEELAELLKKQDDGSAGTGTLAVNNGTSSANTGSNTANTNTSTATNSTTALPGDESFDKTDVVYRVQLGAFKNKISTNVFNTNAGVLELKTGDSYRYVTKGFKTIEEAASVRADLVIQGYSDAFVTAYKDGKRIPMSQTKATVTNKNYKEDLSEDKMFSSVDKKLVSFKVQLGPLKKSFAEKSMDERVKSMGINDVEKQTTGTGSIRYTAGNFATQEAADKYMKELQDKGLTEAFTIATFRGEVISLQEALELLKPSGKGK
jgi:cell division septation protein DedD